MVKIAPVVPMDGVLMAAAYSSRGGVMVYCPAFTVEEQFNDHSPEGRGEALTRWRRSVTKTLSKSVVIYDDLSEVDKAVFEKCMMEIDQALDFAAKEIALARERGAVAGGEPPLARYPYIPQQKA